MDALNYGYSSGKQDFERKEAVCVGQALHLGSMLICTSNLRHPTLVFAPYSGTSLTRRGKAPHLSQLFLAGHQSDHARTKSAVPWDSEISYDSKGPAFNSCGFAVSEWK